MKNYFASATNQEEAKTLYRTLAKQFHPDLAGYDTTEVMKEINSQYKAFLSGTANGRTKEESDELTDQHIEVINKIITCIGIEINVLGDWIWVTGNTFANKEQLKAAGLFYASKKQAWYWRPSESKGGKGKLSLEEIEVKYGRKDISNAKRAALK